MQTIYKGVSVKIIHLKDYKYGYLGLFLRSFQAIFVVLRGEYRNAWQMVTKALD